MSAAGRSGVPPATLGQTTLRLATLRRVVRNRPAPPGRQTGAAEQCEMCTTPIGTEHAHVVSLQSRSLMCTCRPCYLLFTDEHANLHYRSVPERYLSFPGAPLDERAWDELQIPVGLAFLFRNSVQERTVAFYPGPAGATESELPLEAWHRIVARDPRLDVLRADVEALLVRRPAGPGRGRAPDDNDPGGTDDRCFLVPIDACYELVGQLRALWRGFDGGHEAHTAMDAFFDRVRERARPAPSLDTP